MPERETPAEPEFLTAADLLTLGFEEDPLLLEDVSICTLESGCGSTVNPW